MAKTASKKRTQRWERTAKSKYPHGKATHISMKRTETLVNKHK